MPFDGFDFRHPDYPAVLRQRVARLERVRKLTPEELGALKLYYRDHPVEFTSDWGMTFDPRNSEIGLPTSIPFILFPKQAQFIEWVYERWRAREDGLAEKSRDMGVSWLCVGVAAHMWLFFAGSTVGFGSRKEEYVDDIGNMKALFPKIRFFIDNLPREFRPTGWDGGKFMLINNPENGSSIIGESGDNIGRGARTSIYFKDESAFYERADKIEAALSQTSNCKIDVSTPNGSGNPFYRRRHNGKTPIFTFHWRDDPRKDQAWYDKQVRDLDPVILAQEVDIDYNASVNNAWIDGQLFEAAFAVAPSSVTAIGPKILAIDAAHFGDDDNVLTCRQGRQTLPQIVIKGSIDGPDLAGRVVEVADDWGEVELIVIELDGPGVSCFDALKRHPKYGPITVGVHTGARRSDGKNYNLRAFMWRKMLEHLQDAPVCISRDGELKAQATAMLYGYKDGLLLMEAKKDYKKRVGRSPDHADSFALTFAVDTMPKQRPAPVSVPRTVTSFNRR